MEPVNWIITKVFIIIKESNYAIEHEKIKFEKFFEDYKNKKLNIYNFENSKKLHSFYLRAVIINQEFLEIPTLLLNFKNDTKYDLTLKRKEFNSMKN